MSYLRAIFGQKSAVRQGRVVGTTPQGELLVSNTGGRTKKITNSTGLAAKIGANVMVANVDNDQTAVGKRGTRSVPKRIGVIG